MAEFHQRVGVTTWEECLQAVYDHIVHASNTVFQIVDDGTPAIHDGNTFVTNPTVATWATDGCYFALEPVSTPGNWDTGKWQFMLGSTDVSAQDINGNLGAAGDWSSAAGGGAGDFGTAQMGFRADIGVATARTRINDGSDPAVGSQMILSSADNDGYPRLIAVIYDGGGTALEGFYVGGYHPFDPTDTRPVVFLAREPIVSRSASSAAQSQWGHRYVASSHHGRAPLEFGGATSDMTNQGYAIASCPNGSAFEDAPTQDSIRILHEVELQEFQPDRARGIFGRHSFMAVSGFANDSRIGDHLVFNNVALYAPSI